MRLVEVRRSVIGPGRQGVISSEEQAQPALFVERMGPGVGCGEALQRGLVVECKANSSALKGAAAVWNSLSDTLRTGRARGAVGACADGETRMEGRHKTDERDARGLAMLLRNGTLPRVWIPLAELRDQREILRWRMSFLQRLELDRGNRTRTRNNRLAAIHSFFQYVAINEPALALH